MPAGKKDVQKEILALRARIRHHDEKYYRENSPEISDREYDRLMDRLRTLETRYPKYADPNSPTQRVSGAPRKEFATVEHMAPMLSMDNTYSQDELRDFDKRLQKEPLPI
jgi:DNA ligase (NAD+)